MPTRFSKLRTTPLKPQEIVRLDGHGQPLEICIREDGFEAYSRKTRCKLHEQVETALFHVDSLADRVLGRTAPGTRVESGFVESPEELREQLNEFKTSHTPEMR